MEREQLDAALAEVSQLDGAAKEAMSEFYAKGQASLTVAQSLRVASVQTANLLHSLTHQQPPTRQKHRV